MILKPRLFRKPNLRHSLMPDAGFWLFNEGSGNKVFDLSGRGNTGTLENETFWETTRTGAGLGGDGVDDFVSFSWSKLGITGYPFTIVMGCTHHTLGDHSNTVNFSTSTSFKPGFVLRITNSNSPQAFSYGDQGLMTADSPLVVNTDEPVIIVGVFTGDAERTVYANGGNSATNTGFTSINFASIDSFNLFRYVRTDPQYYEKGKRVEFLMIYNRALNASEIVELYLRPFAMFERTPIELWVGATSVGAPPVGMAGAMTTNSGYWGY